MFILIFVFGTETKESNIASAAKQIGVFSNTEVDVNVTKNSASSILKSDNKEETINSIDGTLTQMSAEFAANAAKVLGQTVADIIAAVWDEWKSKTNKCFSYLPTLLTCFPQK